MKPFANRFVANGSLLIATLLLMEATLQGLTRLPEDLRLVVSLKRYTTYARPDRDLYWKKKFLEAAGGSEHPATEFYDPDPYLGWTPKPRLTGRISTNGQGFRSFRDYAPDPERYVVLVVGDSFTFGDGAKDEDVWPTILQASNGDLQVLNFAVSGYGVGQMYLMLERQIGRYSPDLVVAAFIDDDLKRTLLSFRAYRKPRFELEDGRLALANVPLETDVGRTVRAVRKELALGAVLSEIRLLGLARNVLDLFSPEESADPELTTLNEKLFEEMASVARRHGADFLLVYLPHDREIAEPDYRGYGEELFDDFVRAHRSESLNPRRAFFEQPGADFGTGHYGGPAARVVAREVEKKILGLPSFRGHGVFRERSSGEKVLSDDSPDGRENAPASGPGTAP